MLSLSQVPTAHYLKCLSEGAINRSRSKAKWTVRPRAEAAVRARIELQTRELLH